jgi:hypothetical protein
MLMLKPLGICALNWIRCLQVASCLLVGKGSSSRMGCDGRWTRSISRWQLKWVEKQVDDLGWESTCTSAVRNLRLSLRYGAAVFMTRHFCAQNPSLLSCFSKIIPQTARLLSNAYIETQHQNALSTTISTFFISVTTSFWLNCRVCVEMG